MENLKNKNTICLTMKDFYPICANVINLWFLDFYVVFEVPLFFIFLLLCLLK